MSSRFARKEYIVKDTSKSSYSDDKDDPYGASRDSKMLRAMPEVEERLSSQKADESTLSIYNAVKNVPLVDWAYTPLCINFLKGKTRFNSSNDARYFAECEIDYVIQMIKDKFQHFQQTDAMLPFYTKGFETL